MSAALNLAIATCATALDLDRSEFARRVATARKAGWRGVDAVAAAYLAVADPAFGRVAPWGLHPVDVVAAAIFRCGPRRARDAASRLQSAIVAAGGDWRNGREPHKRNVDALADAAHALHPGDTRRDREARQRIREALASGQFGFGGAGWGVTT